MNDRPETRGPTGDPLRLFVAELERNRAAPHYQQKRFASGEHVWLGNAGLQRACERRGEVAGRHNRVARRSEDVVLSYGEIVALSGDFYASPEDLFDERPALVPWLWEDNDLSDLQAAFAAELKWIRGARGLEYPDKNLAYWWNAKHYIELALANDVHFGWHNVVAYCRHHATALEQARRARETGDPVDWRRARYTNGFADHFLTDAFAAGHIRVPRAQTRAWAAERGYSEKLAGTLCKLVHDQDGHVDTLHGDPHKHTGAEGLRVTNARGDDWVTRCDNQLFIARVKDPAIEQPVAAVAASCDELLGAYLHGEVVTGEFAALERVPFPHPAIESFCAKFTPRIDSGALDALVRSVAWYSKIPLSGARITCEVVLEYFAALPAIMKQFRADVAADAAHEGRIDHTFDRLPAAYIEAFKRIE